MAKFCSECGTGLEEGDRFCTKCGARIDAVPAAAAPAPAAAAPAPAPTGPAPAPPRPARSSSPSLLGQLKWEIVLGLIYGVASALLAPSWAKGATFVTAFATAFVVVLIAHVFLSLVARVFKPLAVLLALLLLLGGTATAAGLYIVEPDMPGGLARFVPDIEELLSELRPVSEAPVPAFSPPPPLATRAPDPTADRTARVAEQIRALGLPVKSVYVVTAPDGRDALVVALSYERMTSALSESFGFGEGVDAYVKLAQAKAIDLDGLGYVTTVLQDDAGRPILGVTARSADIEAFRAGRTTRTDLIRAIAFKGESRQGMVDALRGAFK